MNDNIKLILLCLMDADKASADICREIWGGQNKCIGTACQNCPLSMTTHYKQALLLQMPSYYES